MADNVDPRTRSMIMSKVKGVDTSPEIKVRRALHSLGFRFRLHLKDLPGKPDIVLPRFRTVVFVHGCFWHGHGCRRSGIPQTNSAYWKAKIERNRQRDAAAQRALAAMGWTVTVIWECELESGIQQLVAELLHKKRAMNASDSGSRREIS